MNENFSLATGLNQIGVSSKYVLRKTGEEVEVIASEQKEYGARSDEDWVSYIDAEGGEHIKEHLNLQFDFKASDKMSSMFQNLLSLPKPDIWESRRYEMVKEMVINRGTAVHPAIKMVDVIIGELKAPDKETQKDDGYENIGVGEIAEAIDGPEKVKRFVFTDRKDIVGYRGDSGRWSVGDRVKVYIKRLEPHDEERPVPGQEEKKEEEYDF